MSVFALWVHFVGLFDLLFGFDVFLVFSFGVSCCFGG